MKTKNYKNSKSKTLAFTAIFSTLCCIATYFINIPLPTSGFFNAGDIFVLLSGWMLGPLYGSIAAGFGSMLADIISGYSIYAPATLIIKALMAFLGWFIHRSFKMFFKNEKADIVPRVISATISEVVMTLSYFLYNSLILQYGWSALANIPGSIAQGIAGVIGSALVVSAIYPIKKIKNYFPYLTVKFF